MANWNNPVLTSNYADWPAEVKDRDTDVALMFDPAHTSPTNTPTNAIGWNSTNSRFEKYNGSTWAALDSNYEINVTSFGGSAITEFLRLTAGGAQTITGGKLTIAANTATPLDLQGGTADHVYIQLYPDASATTTRRGYLGFFGAATEDLSIVNEYSSGNLVLTPGSGGYLNINSNRIDMNSGNMSIGNTAGENISSGTFNTLIGDGAGNQVTTSGNHTFVGYNAGNAKAGGLGNNTAVGFLSLTGSDPAECAALGAYAGYASSSHQSVFIGSWSGYNQDGFYNVFIGYQAGFQASSQTCERNVVIGHGVGDSMITGADRNTLIGYGAGGDITTGARNVCIGYEAGPTTNVSDRLYIDNQRSALPLIYGEFDNNIVTINGALGVTQDLSITEASDHASTPAAGVGLIWVKDNDPSSLYYTDDAGTDWAVMLADSAGDEVLIKEKIIEIGDWDMDIGNTNLKSVAHGLTYTSIISVEVFIRNDIDSGRYSIDYDPSTGSAGTFSINSTNIVISRAFGGTFDSTSFDSTSYNRGWVIIKYI